MQARKADSSGNVQPMFEFGFLCLLLVCWYSDLLDELGEIKDVSNYRLAIPENKFHAFVVLGINCAHAHARC